MALLRWKSQAQMSWRRCSSLHRTKLGVPFQFVDLLLGCTLVLAAASCWQIWARVLSGPRLVGRRGASVGDSSRRLVRVFYG